MALAQDSIGAFMSQTFVCTPITLHDWRAIEHQVSVRITQSADWLEFLKASQQVEPFLLSLARGGQTSGWFVGAVVRRFGLKLLGAPIPGWTTSYMGCAGLAGENRMSALESVKEFAFAHGMLHMEVMDHELTEAEVAAAGYRYRPFRNSEVDLDRTDAALLASFDGDVRTNCRYAERQGVTFARITDRSFVATYYAQMSDIFAQQGLRPTYSQQRVEQLWDTLMPTGRLLAAAAIAPSGTLIATGLFPADRTTMYLWGTASDRNYRALRPNEGLFVFAMRYWREMGVTRFDLGGGGAYKEKYNGRQFVVPHLRVSRFRVLETLRTLAQARFKRAQRIS